MEVKQYSLALILDEMFVFWGLAMRLGFICSSGGSAFFSALSVFKSSGYHIEPYIVTDRECGARAAALDAGYSTALIPFIDKSQFSVDCLSYFRKNDIENVLLFYTRLVTAPLIEELAVSNVHPSLLPAYKGIGAVAEAKANKSLLLGASLHKVNEEMDAGDLTSQVLTAGLEGMSLVRANKISYLQKVWLTLNWLESQCELESEGFNLYPQLSSVSIATRALSNQMLSAFECFEDGEIRWLVDEV